MLIRHIPCGNFVNESERTSIEYLRNKLQGSSNSKWILLSNLHHSQHFVQRSDEIDLIVIGPSGVRVVEIKHWDMAWLKDHQDIANYEAERINDKAKRVAGKLRKKFDLEFIPAYLLLTRGADIRFDDNRRPQYRGVSIFGISEWKKMLLPNGTAILTDLQIEEVANLLEPTTKITLTGELRTFAGLINLERLSDKSEVFHRVYRGQHSTRRDRVILHLYDLSASQEKSSLELAQREYETLQRWQKSSYVPNLLDSFQEAEGYPGEMYFFTLVDPAASTLTIRAKDPEWNISARLAYAQSALKVLANFHQPENPDQQPPLLHRGINPNSLRVRHNEIPLFTDFRWARLQDAQTLGNPALLNFGTMTPYVAPELLSNGLSAATQSSDIYALCVTLGILFTHDEPLAIKAQECLRVGYQTNPANRPTLKSLIDEFAKLQEISSTLAETSTSAIPPSQYWDEDTIVSFKNSKYKIISALGEGGIGRTFKVVELDPHSEEKFGTYVAKLVRDPNNGAVALNAYKRVRAYTIHPNLSAIYEIATEWKKDQFVALLKWIEGIPLQDLFGVLSIHAEDLHLESAEILVQHWLEQLCDGLSELHRVGLVHGDVSPRNILVQGNHVILTDYDTVALIGQPAHGGVLYYSSQNAQDHQASQPSDDVYALAATLFHALYDREPFLYGTERIKARGINWENLPDTPLRSFLDKATHSQPEQRFHDALAARKFLSDLIPITPEQKKQITDHPPILPPTVPLIHNEVPWLRDLLSAYPGSRHGNSETRGLDSSFAHNTYVETRLDAALLEEIQSGQINLVIIFGNAGDGKTAFLQHVAERLGVKNHHSSQRVWECRLENGMQLRVNLDGSAAWGNKSANQILDEFFNPFRQENYEPKILYIVAINSGKLLEWIESQLEDSYLTKQLRLVLLGEKVDIDPRFRLIDLNARSLVGGLDTKAKQISTDFLDSLLNRLLNDHNDPWQSCITCSAQSRCTAWHSVQILRNPNQGPNVRQQLTNALQACHQRGEIHITARELRATLSYLFFGVHDCAELHNNLDLQPDRYFQRAFNIHSPQRQGELLGELVKLDPALEADPVLDRALLKEANGYVDVPEKGRLAWARRRAYFEKEIFFANGRHFVRFRNLPLSDEVTRKTLCRDLCLGIARLEDLPPIAFKDHHLQSGVPLHLTPRTPTETTLWVIKPWERFTLEASLPISATGLEALPTQLLLRYRYVKGEEEILCLGLELFSLLLELKDGMQLSGGQEGVFAHLKIFTQRLAQEDAREIYGFHPTEEGRLFNLRVKERDGRQCIVREVL